MSVQPASAGPTSRHEQADGTTLGVPAKIMDVTDDRTNRQVILVLADEIACADWQMASGETIAQWVSRECPDNDDVMGEVQIAIEGAVNSAKIAAARADGYEVVEAPWPADVFLAQATFPGVPTDDEVRNSPQWKGGLGTWEDRACSEIDVDGIVASVAAEFRNDTQEPSTRST